VLLTADAAPPRVLERLAELLPGDVRLETVTLDYGEHVDLQLRVAARNPASFDMFVERLQRSRWFTQVLPGEEVRKGGMTATVRGRWTGGR
jgi:Tfp pilus assembly protein PilN